jgi:hypothetical protein
VLDGSEAQSGKNAVGLISLPDRRRASPSQSAGDGQRGSVGLTRCRGALAPKAEQGIVNTARAGTATAPLSQLLRFIDPPLFLFFICIFWLTVSRLLFCYRKMKARCRSATVTGDERQFTIVSSVCNQTVIAASYKFSNR